MTVGFSEGVPRNRQPTAVSRRQMWKGMLAALHIQVPSSTKQYIDALIHSLTTRLADRS